MNDPAFLFYSSDFLSGISDLTMEERGQFITLLCLQHQKGVLNEKTIRLSVGSVSVDVISKFAKNDKGEYYNERLKIETEKRNNFTESRRNNGLLGGRPKLSTYTSGYPNGKPKNNHMDNHMGNRNENINVLKNKRGIKFSEDFKTIIFEDGEEELTISQQCLAKNNDVKANEYSKFDFINKVR